MTATTCRTCGRPVDAHDRDRQWMGAQTDEPYWLCGRCTRDLLREVPF